MEKFGNELRRSWWNVKISLPFYSNRNINSFFFHSSRCFLVLSHFPIYNDFIFAVTVYIIAKCLGLLFLFFFFSWLLLLLFNEKKGFHVWVSVHVTVLRMFVWVYRYVCVEYWVNPNKCSSSSIQYIRCTHRK